ncbi:MAG: anthranilate synthase component I [Pelagibacterales bacterium]|nr:anthranilate synthase component I [Pelagibacterales bacterium]OUU61293.1 MAG: anthranilate synthase component I [Alphaproteobacteria bacterium TMED62]
MTIVFPKKNEFLYKCKKKENQILWTTLQSDLDTPVSTYLKLCDKKTNSFLLESVQDGTYRGRYSIIGFDPDLIWTCKKGVAYKKKLTKKNSKFIKEYKKPLFSLQDLISSSKINLPNHLPPMSAGLIGYLGYEIIEQYEKLPKRKRNTINIPDGFFIRPTTLAIFDNIKNEITLIHPYWHHKKNNYANDCKKISNYLINLKKLISNPLKYKTKKPIKKFIKPKSNIKKNTFLEMVKKAKNYIHEGDIFQVVLSQRFKTKFLLSPFELYRSLRSINPSPFLFYMNLEETIKEEFSIIGSSPEILVKLKNNEITIRPIAGTRKRGKDIKEDIKLKKDLLSDPKEISEHLMLLDLGRNDVGKMSKVDSVKVTEKMKVELYSHVMHIVSNVIGIAKSTKNIVEILMSGFPAGTVSGAPKIRAMEIINELEPEARGVYAGCVGYFSANGDMETCIALRTAIVKNKEMHVQAGAGIVADSVPEKEYIETLNKTAALFKAAEISYSN